MAPTKIRLLGSFEVERGDSILHANEWRRKKAADLLKRLALEKRLLKDQAIEFLWPETDVDSGTNNLYKTIHVLRQTLNSALGPGASKALFEFEDGILKLLPKVWVDAHQFESLYKQALDLPAQDQTVLLEEALSIYRGELLPDDLYADWTLLHREELVRLHREAALTLAQYRIEQDDYTGAIQLIKPLLRRDPADEEMHRMLMRLYAISGRRHDALRQYQTCVDYLESELDAPPGAETTALYDQILNNKLSSTQSGKVPVTGWSLPVPVSFEPDRSSLITGRRDELEAISGVFEMSMEGNGRTILISGESGIGKTRLAMEALRLADQAGMQTLLGAVYEQEGRLPFQPFIEAFDHFLAQKGRHPKENPIIHFRPQGSSDPQQEHWALFKATANFILELAEGSGLVFLIDDLHAADETSLQLFHYLSRQTRSAPVVLMAAYRIDSPTSAKMYPLASALYREGLSESIQLESITREAAGQIMEDILGGMVNEQLCQAIFDVTAGNPLFTEEMTRALLKQGKLEKSEEGWSLISGEKLRAPDNLSSFIHQKVSRMGAGVQAALTAAAVIGREFSFDVLQGVTDLSSGEILDALDDALVGQLIEETASGYRFRHPLIRRSLYDSLSRVRRANLHGRTAQAIEAAYALRPNGISKQIPALAHHYDLSDRRDRALPYLVQAGENSAGVYAFEVAIDYFERALALMEELGRPDPALRWRLLESLGWWHGGVLADTPQAVACFEQALEIGTEPGQNQEWRPSKHDIVRVHCGAAVALITAGDMDTAEGHLHKALSGMVEGEDAPEYADLFYNLAQLHWHRNEYQQAMDVAQRSLTIAERLNKPDAIARAFEMLALACHSLGEWQAGIAYEQQRAEFAGTGLDVTDAFDVHL
jgi:DNA-binding SARP family transcriptional activator